MQLLQNGCVSHYVQQIPSMCSAKLHDTLFVTIRAGAYHIAHDRNYRFWSDLG